MGVESAPTVHELERGGIRRFADAIGDPNPIYRDPRRRPRCRVRRRDRAADVPARAGPGPRAPAVPAPVP